MNIDQSRLIIWNGKVDEQNLSRVMDKILHLAEKSPKKAIFLWVCSSGGSTSYGYSFFDFVRTLGIDLVTIGSGDISSIGLVIWLAGRRRFLTSNTAVFFHENRRMMPDGGYSSAELGAAINNLDAATGNYVRILTEKSGGKLDRKKIMKLLKHDRTLRPKRMVKIGLAHKII